MFISDIIIIKTKIKNNMETYNKLKELVASMEEDAQKFFDKGNSSAGSRLRKSAQEGKKLFQELRINVQDAKKATKA